jgi:hypothetical protein
MIQSKYLIKTSTTLNIIKDGAEVVQDLLTPASHERDWNS